MAEPAAGPSLLRRSVADLVALGIGAGWTWFGAVGLREIIPALGPNSLAGVVVTVGLWCTSGSIAAELRDALLRRWGVALPEARTPRNARAVLAWAGGLVAACAPFAVAWGIARVLGESGAAATNLAGKFAIFVAPTVAVLATRGLCRRWSAPPAASPPPAAAATGAPSPRPIEPVLDPPGPQFLPSPA